jgi:hypothetical protein
MIAQQQDAVQEDAILDVIISVTDEQLICVYWRSIVYPTR